MKLRLGTMRGNETRRLISLTVLFSFLLASVPLPMTLPAKIAEKETSESFPCQSRMCGCRTAAQCWKSCCCTTKSQKLAWAKEHGVTPPAFLLSASQENSQPSIPVKRSGCGLCQKSQRSPKTATNQSRSKLVVGFFAQGCQRAGETWWGQAVAVILPEPSFSLGLTLTAETVVCHLPSLRSQVEDPPTPPPRLSA